MATVTYSTRTQLSDILLTYRDLPKWAHPEVHYWYPVWRKIRDCVAGEKAIKAEGSRYLPALDQQTAGEYNGFLERATFHNFTSRTVNAMAGSVSRRRPAIENLPESRSFLLDRFTIDSLPFWQFSSYVAKEVIQMGRLGLLVDMPDVETTRPEPYVVSYTAENIMDWDTEIVDGRRKLVYVVLREARRIDPRATDDAQSTMPGYEAYAPRYRVLRLENGVYRQDVYESDHRPYEYDLKAENLVETITPVRRGAPLDFIPFYLVGSHLSTASVEKPPMEDIANLNVSHYQSYAYLEHGRFFTAFPMYWVESPMSGGDDGMEFRLGSSSVWVIPPGAKAGLLEMNGQGLKFLENALDTKEHEAAQIGGRLMGIKGSAASMSDNQLTMQERNEQSTLLNITLALDTQMTHVMRAMAYMSGISLNQADQVTVEYNKDFLYDNAGARELRAIHSMYMDGVLPVEVFFSYMKKSDVIPDWMELTDFIAFMENPASFPNNPDTHAKQREMPDRKTELAEEVRQEEVERSERIRKEMLARADAMADNEAQPDNEEPNEVNDGQE